MTNLTNAMNKQDKFFEQFQEAARQTEQQRFPGFEEVWQQVENRLDREEQPKAASFSFKRMLAIAASFLALLMIGFAIYQSRQMDTPQVVTKKEPESGPAIVLDSAAIKPQQDLPEVLVRQVKPEKPLNNSEMVKESKPVTETLVVAETTPVNEIWVKGIVTDTLGQPVSFASVVLEGTNRGVTADNAGAFLLKANKGDMLSVNAVGYDSKKLKVYQSDEMKVEMVPANTSLSEVVVTGYGSQKKTFMAGSVAAVNSGQNKVTGNSLNVEQQLQGRVPGVYVQNTGRSKREMMRQKSKEVTSDQEIRIRGLASVQNGNEPLYIINGTIVNATALKSLGPDKIDKVNVLKDASATAIYGSRGQNGVILITTKSLTKKEEDNLRLLNEELQRAGVKNEPSPGEVNPDEDYNPLVENPFTSPQVSPLSTFSIDVDNASYTNIRRFINNGQKVPADAVRIEEMINFFTYRYEAPTGDKPFAAHTEYSDAPWNKAHKLLRIALKAKDIPAEQLPPCNIVFLLDVSGSMEDPNKLPLLKSSMKVLVDQLRKEDKVSIVVYAGAAGLVLPPTGGDQKATIMQALDNLQAGGSTAGGAGIELAYKTAAENFVMDGNNRVVLATDGDFNVGINSAGDLQHLIEEKRKTGIFLTCLGFGMGNYKDNRLETLADKGNGNYAYIDNMQESNRFLGREFKGSMFAVAKDVKLQIEFNPAQVKSYRLIGYENRKLNDEDFVNDKIDAGEMGIGHTVTALYEIIPVGVNSSFAPQVPPLKYSNTQPVKSSGQELATIKFRYKKPDGDTSTETAQVVSGESKPLQNASEDFRFAAAVAWFGLKLRHSELITDKAMQNIISLAKTASRFDPDGYRAECIRLMESAK